MFGGAGVSPVQVGAHRIVKEHRVLGYVADVAAPGPRRLRRQRNPVDQNPSRERREQTVDQVGDGALTCSRRISWANAGPAAVRPGTSALARHSWYIVITFSKAGSSPRKACNWLCAAVRRGKSRVKTASNRRMDAGATLRICSDAKMIPPSTRSEPASNQKAAAAWLLVLLKLCSSAEDWSEENMARSLVWAS